MKLGRKFKETSFLCSVAFVAASLFPTLSAADTVNLSSPDGSVDITGELLVFQDDTYVVRTELGDMSILAERVICSGDGCPSDDKVEADVTFAGSETIGTGVMPLLLEGYATEIGAAANLTEKEQQFSFNGSEKLASFVDEDGFGAELDTYLVHSTDSVQGFRDLLNKKAEFSMASRRISDAEAAALAASGAGDMKSPAQEHIFASDSIIIVTHPDNPVKSISMKDIAAVFTGRINNWAQLGGPNMPIRVVTRQSDSGIRTTFAERIFGGPNLVVGNARIATSSSEMADVVAADPAAIGYTGYAFKRGAKSLDVINECGVVASADEFTIRTETYPLHRRLFLYNRADTSSKAGREFLKYALSPAADEIITKAGFVDFGVVRRGQGYDSARAKQLLNSDLPRSERPFAATMLQEMRDYDQLSTTFRFRTGSAQLDERALVDMERLTAFLEEQPSGTSIRIVGFTDSVGSFGNNRRLAAGRAEQVRRSLIDYAGNRVAGLRIATSAYGELAPSACNTLSNGRAINRRVEVWIDAKTSS